MLRVRAALTAVSFFLCTAVNAADTPRTLTFTGIAPVTLNMTLAQAEVALGVKLTPRDPKMFASDACWYSKRADGQDGYIGYMVNKDRIVRIDVAPFFMRLPPVDKRWQAFTPPASTEAGIHYGSTKDQVLKTYARHSVTIDPNPNGGDDDQYIGIKEYGRVGILVFETSGNVVNDMRVGLESVVYEREPCV
jgi:hypothetical protein